MYCGLVGIEGTFRMVVGRKVSIDESLAQAVTKQSVDNLQQATGIMNAGRDVCWEDVAAKELSRAFNEAGPSGKGKIWLGI